MVSDRKLLYFFTVIVYLNSSVIWGGGSNTAESISDIFWMSLLTPFQPVKSGGEGKKSTPKMDRWQQRIPMVFFCISVRDVMSAFLEVTVSSTISWFTYSSWMMVFSWALNALLVRQNYQMWFCSCSLVEVIVILSPTWMRWESEMALFSCIPIYFS